MSSNPTQPIDYKAIAIANGFVYVGPCGCKRKKGFDFQRGQYTLRCHPHTLDFSIFRYGRLFRNGQFHELSNKLVTLPAA